MFQENQIHLIMAPVFSFIAVGIKRNNVENILPKSRISNPMYETRGFGMTIVVCPAYAINNGRAAIDGKTSFLSSGFNTA